ncbi:unnamed protein product [Closterium sp. NIES-54]
MGLSCQTLPGELPVFKARYCAKGFTQREGIDYFATYSPTARLTTLRLLDLGARWDWEIHSMDVSNAFLQGELHERIFLERPAVFPRPFPPGTVWELKRPVYGLKQAPHEWHAKLASTLHSLGFSTSASNPSLFIPTSPHRLYILAYVDDLVLLAEDSANLAAFKQALRVRLLCKDLGELCHYLGMEIRPELYTGTLAAQEARWLSFLLAELGHSQRSVTLSYDSASMIHLAENPVYHARSKHIEARYFFVRELVQYGFLRLRKVTTTANLAGIFTKALLRTPHRFYVRELGLMRLATSGGVPVR